MAEGLRRPRVPVDLAARIDGVRGDVPFERWVRRALEQALGRRVPDVGTMEAAPGSSASPGATPVRPASARAPEAGPLVRSSGKRVDPAALARQAGLNKGKS